MSEEAGSLVESVFRVVEEEQLCSDDEEGEMDGVTFQESKILMARLFLDDDLSNKKVLTKLSKFTVMHQNELLST